MTILIFVFIVLLVLFLTNNSNENIAFNVRRREESNMVDKPVIKTGGSSTLDTYRKQRSPQRFDLLQTREMIQSPSSSSLSSTSSPSMDKLLERLDSLEEKINNTQEKNEYPTFEQLVVMRRDIDNLNTVTIPELRKILEQKITNESQRQSQSIEERLNSRLEENLKERLKLVLNEQLDQSMIARFKEQANEYVNTLFAEQLNDRLTDRVKEELEHQRLNVEQRTVENESSRDLLQRSIQESAERSREQMEKLMNEKLDGRLNEFDEQLKKQLTEQLNRNLDNYLQQQIDAKIVERFSIARTNVGSVSSADSSIRTTNDQKMTKTTMTTTDALNTESIKTVKDLVKEQLIKYSMPFVSTNIIRISWLDARGSFLNDNNQLLHSYMENADVTIVHHVTLNENRFFSHLRKVGSVDIFHPVHDKRSQFLALIVTGSGEKKKTLTASGICLNPNINFQFDRTKVYESKNVRLLTVWGLLFDHVHTIFGAFFVTTPTTPSTSTKDRDQWNDRKMLLDRLTTDMNSMQTYEKVAYRSNDYRLFMLGDFGLTNESFHALREQMKTTLRSEFDSCVKGSILTSLTNGFYHNVHALTNTNVLDFDVTQTLYSSMCVRVTYTTTYNAAMMRDTKRRRRYGATIDASHNRTIE